jgi:type I restriction enzyme S subunit
MKQEIKERVERIRNGEVPEGYKMTKVGIIPKEWEMKKLGDAAEVVMGQSPVGTSYNHSGTGAPLINGPTEFTVKYPIKIQWTSQPTKFCKKGDILLCVRGSSTGRMNISDDEYCIGRGVAAIRAKSGADTLFITFQVESAVKSILTLTTGSTFPNIDGKSIKTIQFPLPPLSEQQKIAEILSTWDKAIELQEKQISYSNEHKKGFMQKLLFKREAINILWTGTKLRNCLIPTSYPVNKPSEPYYALGIRSHCKGTLVRYIEDPNKIAMDTLYEVKENELIVNITFAWEGAITILSKKDEGKLVSHRFPTYKFNEEYVSLDYFRHLIKTKWFVFQLGLLSPGGAGRNRVLNKTDLLKLEVILPPIEEQRKIADFLNSIDNEIELLKLELNQLKEQKRGLMQLLLTGIVRVEVN